MLNLKKVILGLGLLGVVSSANAAFIECPQSGYLPDGKFYNKDWKVRFDPEFMTADGRIFASWGRYKEPYDQCGAADDSCYTSYNNVPEGYKEIPYESTMITLCSVKYSTLNSWVSDTCTGTTIKCLLKKGNIDVDTSTTAAVSTLTNENNILKAKVQALETKVYQCVQ